MSMMHASTVKDAAAASLPPTASLMRWVIVATLPGIATMSYFFGLGVISNVVLAAAFGIALEAAVLRLRMRPIRVALNDSSALLTGVLLVHHCHPLAPGG
ncbi:hypothetical protein HORIV_30580 [Vreelandella olivaria]|uniref:Electron transport complex protein RnfD n=1 Tax=Vreelandella olivaria TaxID=390919 RepID=A0ABM7GJ03_9GAMM|nr:hypothetical protein HORIV_30580 [Halomonas olivaria]